MTNDILLPETPKTRALYPGGPQVSSIAWGMWRFQGDDVAAAQVLVEAALDAGISLLDTADIYGLDGDGFGAAEALLGKVLSASPDLRSRMFLASKGGIMPPLPYNSSADYIASAIDASLKRLGVEAIDLWQIHRPDILTAPQEVARALQDAVTAGKIGAVGVSNYTSWQISALMPALDVPIASTQPEYSPLCLEPLENGELDQAMASQMAVLAWSPLGGGRIANPSDRRERAVAAALDKVADAYDVSRAAATFSWIMAHPAGIIPILGSQNAGRIADAVNAFNVRWTRQSWYDVLVAARGEPLP